MTLFTWSQTASENDDADGTINFAEGQAPGSLNNSARALMAAAAKYRDDLSGNLELGGTSTAYTVSTNQSFTSLSDGIHFAAKPGVANGAAPTLAPDGLTAKAIEAPAGTAVSSGALQADVPYMFVYDATADAWLVHGLFNALLDLVDDTTPQLGGDLDLNGNAFDFPTTANVSDCLDEDDMSSDSATSLATQQSIKAYADDNFLPGESGTKALFQQTAAPTGWTKDTTHDDKALRVVSGTASSGGTNSFSSRLTDTFTTANPGGGAFNAAAGGTAVSTTSHSHNVTLDVQFVDLIIATKD